MISEGNHPADNRSVLVVGAGPAGLAAANRLARNGAELRIIDSAATGTRFSKALAVNLRSLDILAPSGISDKLIAAGQKIRRMILHEGRDRLATLHLDRIDRPHPFILSLPQNETERLLAEGLAELGVVVDHYGAGRVFLCGDAAHIHSPTGGRGVNLGIEDATVLADRIRHGGLETYSADRRPIGASIIRQTDAMLSIMASRNPLARRVRNMAIRYLLPWEPMQSRLRSRIMGLAD